MTSFWKPSLARFALCALIALTGCAKSDAQWSVELGREDPFVRGLAAIGLSLRSPARAADALPVLLETIDRSEVGLQAAAVSALTRIAVHNVDALVDALIHEEFMTDDRRRAVLLALVAAGPAAAGPITLAMQGPARRLSGDLGETLLRMGPASVPSLIALLQGPEDAPMQDYACFLLGQFGPPARAALPSLNQALQHSNEGVRKAAARALQSIQSARGSSSRGGR